MRREYSSNFAHSAVMDPPRLYGNEGLCLHQGWSVTKPVSECHTSPTSNAPSQQQQQQQLPGNKRKTRKQTKRLKKKHQTWSIHPSSFWVSKIAAATHPSNKVDRPGLWSAHPTRGLLQRRQNERVLASDSTPTVLLLLLRCPNSGSRPLLVNWVTCGLNY